MSVRTLQGPENKLRHRCVRSSESFPPFAPHPFVHCDLHAECGIENCSVAIAVHGKSGLVNFSRKTGVSAVTATQCAVTSLTSRIVWLKSELIIIYFNGIPFRRANTNEWAVVGGRLAYELR